MLCYGSLEMTHDFMHYLAAHNISNLHSHEHDHHHTFHDHEHGHHHDHQERITHTHHHSDEATDETLPSLISFFLFIQKKPAFSFHKSSRDLIFESVTFSMEDICHNPATPPPEKL
jgi:hypothetical protein